MKYENLFKIHIPEPCNEDWGKMTPNEEGAYCKVCAKTVVDFSGRSDEEIQRYLLENSGSRICGRFNASQLENNEVPRLKVELPKYSFPGFLMPVITPFRAYAMALMLFASAAAFTACGNSNTGSAGDDEKLAGAVELVEDSTCNTRVVGKIRPIEQDTVKTDTTETMIKGEIEPKKTHGVLMKIDDEK